MSVTFHLYKVLPDIDYKGFYLDFYRPANKPAAGMLTPENMRSLDEYERSLGAPGPDEDRDLYFEWFQKQEAGAWSDGKNHVLLDISYYKDLFGKSRGWNRMVKRLNKFQIKFFDNIYYTKKYLACDEVLYRQGWFLKPRFFNKEITCSICTTKEEMQHFFQQYIRYTGSDKRGPETVKRFIEAWEDGMIFVCIW